RAASTRSRAGKEEVEINGVVYEEFRDLLYVIYPGVSKFTDSNVIHILGLADRFQMKGVMDQVESYIIDTPGIKRKLHIADRFRLTKLRDHCLNSFASAQSMIQEFKSPQCADFSDELKLAIYDRIMKF
ncbi:hypothetical protein PMAYCL1PPCAC_24977, partial [Pristionchus mayeri]